MARRWRVVVGTLVAIGGAVSLSACGGGDAGGEEADGKAVFMKAGCAQCHTLKDAGATGIVGANLDELKPNELKVEVFVTNGSPPNMPPFKGTLSDDEIKAVAAYVSEVTGGNDV